MLPYCASVKVFYINRWLLPLQMVLGWMEGLPLQVSYFLDRTIKKKVQYHIIHVQPDHIVCQLIRAVPYVESLPFTKTLDYMDVFSVGMWQRVERSTLFGFLYKAEALRLARYERSVYKEFDRHIIISEQDKMRLKLPSREFITVIPNGVDESFLQVDRKPQPDYDLLFVGNLGYGPNIEAVLFLVHHLLPALKRQQFQVRLLVAGARPVKKILNLNKSKGITVAGWMDDIRVAYRDARIFIAPMFSGLGLQNKILEAMSIGLPCITTTMVNNAIGAKPGDEILIADNAEEMAAHIILLLSDQDHYERISERARSFIAVHYRWEDQVRRMEEVLISKNAYLSR